MSIFVKHVVFLRYTMPMVCMRRHPGSSGDVPFSCVVPEAGVRHPSHSMHAAALRVLIPMLSHVILGRPVTSRSPALCWRRVLYAEAFCELRTHSHDLTRHPGSSGDVLLPCVVAEAGMRYALHSMDAATFCELAPTL